MTPPPRDLVMAALEELVAASPAILTTGRRLEYWTSLAATQMPAVYLDEPAEEIERPGGAFPPLTTLLVDLWVYVATAPDAPPAAALDPVLDALDAALAPTPGTRQTLGGLVYHCWIGGAARHAAQTKKELGHAGTVAAAIVPVRILLP